MRRLHARIRGCIRGRIPTRIPTRIPARIPTRIPTRIRTRIPTRIPRPIFSWFLSGVAPPRPLASPSRLRASIALGTALATRGILVKLAIGLGALLTLVGVALALFHNDSAATLVLVPAAASSALAWGAGVPVAFAASIHAFREDRARGIRALLHARGARANDYASGRVLGLALVVFAVVGGGTLVSGGVGMLVASTVGAAGRAIQGLLASLVFAMAFAVVMAALALAAIGGRTRAGGYVGLLVLLVLPELLGRWTSALVPASFSDLLSVPSALAALRSSIASPEIDAARFARAACVVAAFGALCFALVRMEVARIDAEDEESRA
jgi:hypothetical protein